jgi:hypothetical protein
MTLGLENLAVRAVFGLILEVLGEIPDKEAFIDYSSHLG